jgi:hypothetical protein
MVDEKVDSVFFSLEGVTRDALEKVRGVDKIEKIEAAVFRLLATRGDKEFPRVGVTMTVQDGNRHEEQAFVQDARRVVERIREELGPDFEIRDELDRRFPGTARATD